jgi:uncharacterized protein
MMRLAIASIALLHLLLLLGGCRDLSAESTNAPVAGLPEEDAILGHWSGRADAEEETTAVVLDILRDGEAVGAAMSLPSMGVRNWPASNVDRTGATTWRIVIPSDSGPQPMTLVRDGDVLAGLWRMPGWEEPAQVRLARTAPPTEPPHEQTTVRFRSGAHLLEGMVTIPRGEGPFPGVVFVHGSGPLSRHAYQHEALALADLGIASLAYDKRGVGASEGDFRTADLHELATDAQAAARALGAHPAPIDDIGYYGTSQGGWIAPLAATGDEAAFVVLISGPVVTPGQEDKWDVVRRLRLAGFDEQAEQEAVFVMRQWDHGLRTGDWSRFRAARADAESKPWFRASGMHRSTDFRTDIRPEYVQWYRRFIDYDPIPTLESLRVPVLYVFAREDEHIDAMESYSILRDRFLGPGSNVHAVLYDGYDHSLRHLGPGGQPLRWPTRPNGFLERIAEFIHDAAVNGEPSGT